MFGFKKKKDEKKMSAGAQATSVNLNDENGASRTGGRTQTLTAPVKGRLIPLAQVKDDVFSSGMLGPGAAVIPEEGCITSPCQGSVETVFPTGHAYGIKTEDGLELLIHIGIDTVELDGKGFSPEVKQGDLVKAGDVLAHVDLDAIRAAGYDPTVILVASSLPEGQSLAPVEEKHVCAGDPILNLL